LGVPATARASFGLYNTRKEIDVLCQGLQKVRKNFFMSDLSDLYQEVILDHNRSPRNFHKIEGANRHSVGYNPLCGDKMDLYVDWKATRIKDIGFLGSGCAISKSVGFFDDCCGEGKIKKDATTLSTSFPKW